jgi:hypothetical protein
VRLDLVGHRPPVFPMLPNDRNGVEWFEWRLELYENI